MNFFIRSVCQTLAASLFLFLLLSLNHLSLSPFFVFNNQSTNLGKTPYSNFYLSDLVFLRFFLFSHFDVLVIVVVNSFLLIFRLLLSCIYVQLPIDQV